MKKIATLIFCITCISVIAIAQPGVRIGNMEIITLRKIEKDSIVINEPCPCPPENVTTQPKANYLKQRTYSYSFGGIGFILPDNGSDYYSVIGGNSFNIDIGNTSLYYISRWFALGRTAQYSFYNYELKANEPAFLEEVIGNFAKNDIRKQVYRSHNAAIGAFARLYLIPPQVTRSGWINSTSGMFIDFGAQSDFAFSRFCKLNTRSGGKEKYRDGDAFNPFSASATARIGWDKKAIFARYRFTDAFNQKVLPMDLPPLTIGIQFLLE